MKIITVANQKGGIGKTTTALCLASSLRMRGYATLFVDMDAQCNGTDMYGAQMEDAYTVFNLLTDSDGDMPDVMETVQHTKNGDIIPGDRLVSRADALIQSDPKGMFLLRDALSGLKGYDYVVIDSNPAMNYLLFNSLVASDEVVIPTTADRYGIIGLRDLMETIGSIQHYQNRDLSVSGILLVRHNARTKIGHSVEEQLESIAGQLDVKIFKSRIRESVKIKESQAVRVPIVEYKPHCTSARDYEAFVDELLETWAEGKGKNAA